MSFTTLTADEIAETQLLSALKLWQEQDYLSALTLAGAADEILGKRLRKLGLQPSFDEMREVIVMLGRRRGDTSPDLERTVGEMLNNTRNELKHYAGDASIGFDIRADCQEMIERALANHQVLTGTILSEAIDFWGTLDDS